MFSVIRQVIVCNEQQRKRPRCGQKVCVNLAVGSNSLGNGSTAKVAAAGTATSLRSRLQCSRQAYAARRVAATSRACVAHAQRGVRRWKWLNAHGAAPVGRRGNACCRVGAAVARCPATTVSVVQPRASTLPRTSNTRRLALRDNGHVNVPRRACSCSTHRSLSRE